MLTKCYLCLIMEIVLKIKVSIKRLMTDGTVNDRIEDIKLYFFLFKRHLPNIKKKGLTNE